MLEISAFSLQGKRKENQDAYYLGERLFAVADGMGGLVHGKEAAETFIEVAKTGGSLLDIIKEANTRIFELVGGTACVLLEIEGQKASYTHIGDSRLYLFRNNILTRLTKDHSYIEYLIDKGEISRQESLLHPKRNLLTKALGTDSEVVAEVQELDLEEGDLLLMVTDGVWGSVSEQDLVLKAQLGAKELCELALANGSTDNITAVVLTVKGDNASGDAASRLNEVGGLTSLSSYKSNLGSTANLNNIQARDRQVINSHNLTNITMQRRKNFDFIK